jgi:class 3 adenylate cyclase
MNERESIQQAMASLEQQRQVLGDVAVDAALDGLRRKLLDLEGHGRAPRSPGAVDLVGERKLVTVLFADISGFTALSETMDAEEVRGLVNGCFSALVPLVESHGGMVDKFIGDEIMAVFGAPAAHENDCERALRAALIETTGLSSQCISESRQAPW